MRTYKIKIICRKILLFGLLFLAVAPCYADSFYVGEQTYYSLSYSGILDAAAWYSDRPNDIMIFKDDYGATVSIIQYFSGTATVECQYAYHYYVGTKKYNQTGHLRYSLSCKKSTVTLNQKEVELAIGETLTLSYSNSSGYKIPYPYWEVDNSKIATVDDYNRSTEQTITVKGEAPGAAIVTFFANTGGTNPTCKVTVKDIPATSMRLSPDELHINEGTSARFSVEFTPKNATSSITWSISDESVATISSGGSIKGIKEGTAIVTAKTDNGLTATGKVHVSPQPVTVKLPSSMTLFKGYNKTLTPTLSPSNAVTTYEWYSDTPKIVTVDDAGRVYAKGYGTANITVSTSNGKTGSIAITVVDPDEELDYRNITKRINITNELLDETVKAIK